MGNNFSECAYNVLDTVKILDTLNFVPHPHKSVFIPIQIIIYLGFILNSITMSVSLTPKKAKKLKLAVTRLLSCGMPIYYKRSCPSHRAYYINLSSGYVWTLILSSH
jgi:fatty-acid desaturase